jgi:hypothetical protein
VPALGGYLGARRLCRHFATLVAVAEASGKHLDCFGVCYAGHPSFRARDAAEMPRADGI